MNQLDESSPSNRCRQSKAGGLIHEHDMQGLHGELEQLWTTEKNRRCLQELTSYFNKHPLKPVLEKANLRYLDGEIGNTNWLLTDDDVRSADATRIQRPLERDDINVNALPKNWDALEREGTNVQKPHGRIVTITEGQLDQLRNSDELTEISFGRS